MTIIKKNIFTAILFIIGLLLPTLGISAYWTHMLIFGFTYAVASIGWNILGGYTGQSSFGHAAFFGLGAYTLYLCALNLGIPPFFGLFLGALVGGFGAVLIGKSTFRLRGTFFSLCTMAFAEILRLLSTYFRDFTGGAEGLTLPLKSGDFLWMAFAGKTVPYYFSFVLLVVALFISYRISKSMFGMKLYAIRDNQDAAESLGIDCAKEKSKAAFVSGALTGLAGAFYSCYVYVIDPTIVFSQQQTVNILIYAIVGGSGTVFGPAVGAIVLSPLNMLLNAFFGSRNLYGVNMIALGLILVIIVLVKPTGIYGMYLDVVNWLKKKMNAKGVTKREEVK